MDLCGGGGEEGGSLGVEGGEEGGGGGGEVGELGGEGRKGGEVREEGVVGVVEAAGCAC